MATSYPACIRNTVFSLLLLMTASAAGCGVREQPPFFTARVSDVWNRTLTVENFKILYTWEERGETPFLKPYEYHARELVAAVLVPVAGDSQRADAVTRRIPFRNLKQFSFIRGEAANTLVILLNNNEELLATDKFPQALKKGDHTGLADYAISVEGVVVKDGKREKYQEKLYNIKKAVIVKEASKL
jgi:hypothetical protein